jgi:hypothetical protein
MRDKMRSEHASKNVNTGEVDDPLKGLLKDKGGAAVKHNIQIVQRKMIRVQEAMIRLVDAQRASAKAAGCECMDLYLAAYQAADSTVPITDKASVVFDDLKMAVALEWRAKSAFGRKFNLGRTCRLSPFDCKHKTHALVFDYMMETSPSYYKVLAAYENARLTLNYTLKVLFKIALDLHRIQAEGEHLPHGLFDKATARLSEKFINDTDKTGELTWILQGLYFDM